MANVEKKKEPRRPRTKVTLEQRAARVAHMREKLDAEIRRLAVQRSSELRAARAEMRDADRALAAAKRRLETAAKEVESLSQEVPRLEAAADAARKAHEAVEQKVLARGEAESV